MCTVHKYRCIVIQNVPPCISHMPALFYFQLAICFLHHLLLQDISTYHTSLNPEPQKQPKNGQKYWRRKQNRKTKTKTGKVQNLSFWWKFRFCSYFMKILCNITNLNEFDIQGAQACFKGISVFASSLLKVWESKITRTIAKIGMENRDCSISPERKSCALLPHLSLPVVLMFLSTILIFPTVLTQPTPQNFCFRRRATTVRSSSLWQNRLLSHSVTIGARSP